MIDKEIIIDGVNVAECSYSYFEIYEDLEKKREVVRCSIGSAFNNNRCQNENCYFKQLRRKEQEYNDLISGMDFLQQKLAVKEQQCEELEETINKLSQRVILPMPKSEVINLTDRYKQALEKIKEYTIKQFCENCENIGSTEYTCHCEHCEYYEFLDIINEVNS